MKMIRHLNRKGISDVLLKILLNDGTELNDISQELETEIKYEILEKIIENFDMNDSEVK
jgi:hypothetical protein